MAIFKRRPLATACLALIFALLSFYFIPAMPSLIILCILAGTVVLLIAGYFIFKRNYVIFFIALLLIGILMGSARTFFVLKNEEAVTSRFGDTVSVIAEVEEIRSSRSYASFLEVRLREVDGKSVNLRAILTFSGAVPFYRGDLFGATVRVESLEYENYYEKQAYTYRATGSCAVLVIDDADSITLLESGASNIVTFFEELSASFCLRINRVMEGEEGNLLCALLLGDDSNLSERTVRDFRRAGVSHVLALSGLHVGMIAAIFNRFLLGFRLKKHWRGVCILLVLLFYICITGFSFSMIRSVLMIVVVYLAYFLRQESDGITSLLVVAAAIVLVTPHAIFSLSYQMTILATFGILTFEGVRENLQEKLRKKPLRKPILYLCLSLMITFSASFVILPIQWLNFGEISLITPLANLLVVPFIMPLLLCGLLLLFALPMPLFSSICTVLGKFVLWIVSRLSDADGVLSLAYEFVPYVILPCMVLFVIVLIIDLKKYKPLAFAPIAICIVAFTICLSIYQSINSGEIDTLYLQKGKNESFVMVSTEGSMMIDISNGSHSSVSFGWQAAQSLGATDLDVLLLTHYHNDHAVSLRRFTDRVKVRAVWLPTPTTKKDREALIRILDTMQECDTSIVFYEYENGLTVFKDGILTISTPLYEKRSTQPTVSFLLNYKETAFQYESAVLSEYRRHLSEDVSLIDVDHYFVGAHGPIPHEAIDLSFEDNCLVVIPNREILLLLDIKDNVRYHLTPTADDPEVPSAIIPVACSFTTK